MTAVFVILVIATVVYGIYSIFAFNAVSLVIVMLLLLSSVIAYCGMRLNDIYRILKIMKKPKTISTIPASEARRDFRYLYVYMSDVEDEELRDGLRWLFKKKGYQVIDDVGALSEDERSKVISANFRVKKNTNSPYYTVTIYGNNIYGQTVYSVTKSDNSLSKARESAFDALKQ